MTESQKKNTEITKDYMGRRETHTHKQCDDKIQQRKKNKSWLNWTYTSCGKSEINGKKCLAN